MSSNFNMKPNKRCVIVVGLLAIITDGRDSRKCVCKQGGKSADLFM